jgi:hypothetical protein
MDQGHQLPLMVLQALNFRPFEKANAIADCLDIQFTPHDLCESKLPCTITPPPPSAFISLGIICF